MTSHKEKKIQLWQVLFRDVGFSRTKTENTKKKTFFFPVTTHKNKITRTYQKKIVCGSKKRELVVQQSFS